MKKQIKTIAAVLALTLVSVATKAQFKKADKFAEGTVSFSKTSGQSTKYGVTPTLGYFVTDKFAVGVSADFSNSATEKSTGFGAFGRCYLLPIGTKCLVYSQLNASRTSVETATKTTVINANVGLGANYFVTKNLALSLDLARLMDFTDAGGVSTFSMGFQGIANPLAAAKFGVLYRF